MSGKTALITGATGGDVREYMEISADVGERGPGRDYALATRKNWNSRKMVETLFRRHKLDYADHIAAAVSGPVPEPYRANSARLKQVLGGAPEYSVFDIIGDMLQRERAP